MTFEHNSRRPTFEPADGRGHGSYWPRNRHGRAVTACPLSDGGADVLATRTEVRKWTKTDPIPPFQMSGLLRRLVPFAGI